MAGEDPVLIARDNTVRYRWHTLQLLPCTDELCRGSRECALKDTGWQRGRITDVMMVELEEVFHLE